MLLSFGQGSLRRAVPRRPGQQLLPDGSPPRRPLPAASSRWLSATSLPVCTGVPAGQLLRYGAPASSCFPMLPHCLPCRVSRGAATFQHRLPFRSIPCSASASNKPHPAAKSTAVWLAIWRTWPGFANSQLLRATFRCIYLYTCAHPHCCHVGLLLRQTQIFRPICTDCLRHLRISAG